MAILLVAAVAFFLLPPVLGLARADALPGVSVLGVDVGGMNGEALHDAVAAVAASREQEPITIRQDIPAERSSEGIEEVVIETRDVGYVFDVDATIAAARARGRQLNPFRAWEDHLRSLGGTISVRPVEEVDDDRLKAWADDLERTLALEPIEGAVEIDGIEVVRTDPEPGASVDTQHLAAETRAAALEPGPATLTVRSDTILPDISRRAVDEAVEIAERLLAGSVTLTRGDGTLHLDPTALGELVVFEREDDGLSASLPPEALEARVSEDLRAAFETDPVDAELTIDGDAVAISESAEGFRFDPGAAVAQILDLATGGGPRTATLEGEVLAPRRTTEDAEGLRIVEEVSSFTTEFQPGQSRVVNIQRIADLVHGVVLEPGETFSVNEHVGERTEEQGFVPGGAILDGEFVDQVGGGVSQFATTLYNAAYFGGYDITEHKAHSYYISRYPAGREATLNYPTVDLEFLNSSPYGLLISTSHTDSSVTVSLWGTQWVEVDSIEGERSRIRPGAVRDGFDIVVTRVLRYPDGREEREEQFTRYLPEH